MTWLGWNTFPWGGVLEAVGEEADFVHAVVEHLGGVGGEGKASGMAGGVVGAPRLVVGSGQDVVGG